MNKPHLLPANWLLTRLLTTNIQCCTKDWNNDEFLFICTKSSDQKKKKKRTHFYDWLSVTFSKAFGMFEYPNNSRHVYIERNFKSSLIFQTAHDHCFMTFSRTGVSCLKMHSSIDYSWKFKSWTEWKSPPGHHSKLWVATNTALSSMHHLHGKKHWRPYMTAVRDKAFSTLAFVGRSTCVHFSQWEPIKAILSCSLYFLARHFVCSFWDI